MNSYHYKAINHSGRLVRGEISAVAEADVEQELERRGLSLITASAARKRLGLGSLGQGRPNTRMLVEFYYRFSQALDIGLPIISSLDEIGRSLPSPLLKKIANQMQLALERGRGLHEAMGLYPKVFQPLDLAMVAMGEKTGVLPKCLKDLATYHEWKDDIRSVFKKALLYPAFILCAITAVIGVWIGYVLPQMITVLAEMGVTLPAVTLMMLDASNFVKAHWPVMAVSLLSLVVFLFFYRRTESGAIAVDRHLLRLPVIGRIVKHICLTRLCHNFATMLDAGMNINHIFKTVAHRTVGNRYVESKLNLAHQGVGRGESIADAFETTGAFPSLLIGALRNGEVTGTIDASFKRMGDFYDKEVQRAVQVLINAIEPVAILSLGGIFGLIVLSILLPLYDVLGELGKAY
ncbi:MAG: type II secretion system F family protein [Deltaproteobacteria bacterium]|nr:type II secretion system F family protein [Deltaproteobacteria bacterium]